MRKQPKGNPGVADSVIATLRCARDVYDAAVEAQARKLRVEFVEPLCRKHGWRYRSGMGRFFVCVETSDNMYNPSDVCELGTLNEELSGEAYDDLIALLKVINTDVYSFCHGTDGNPVALLGYYVENVD